MAAHVQTLPCCFKPNQEIARVRLFALAETQTTRSGPETVIPTWGTCGIQVQLHTKGRCALTSRRARDKECPCF
jgi:hypothetical protein